MFGFFKKRAHFDDEKQQQFVEAIATMLEVQMVVSGSCIENAVGTINPKALGYIYGFIDAALRTIGQDMSDNSIGIPVTFQILRRLFSGREEKYLAYLAERMGTDQVVTIAAMTGGQQYIDFHNKKVSGPMGLARYILERGNSPSGQLD